MECGHCHAWSDVRDATTEQLVCAGCGHYLQIDQAKICRVPTAFRTNFWPKIKQEDADTGVRHRSIQAEGKALPFGEQTGVLGQHGSFRLGFDETTRTFRLNRGPELESGGQAFEVQEGTDRYPRPSVELPAQVVSTQEALRPREFESTSPSIQIWLASPKTTDAIYLLPTKLPPGLALHRLPARSDSPVIEGTRWLGVRAAALSATYLVVNRASLELDIDPEEFDVLEPRLYGAETRLPLLEFTDHLVNGAGFCRTLASSDGKSAPISRMIRSMLQDGDRYPRKVFEGESHADCDTACYRCLLRYGNQAFHGLLDWPLGLTFLRAMVDPEFVCGLGGDFSAPGLARWQSQARRLAGEMADRFKGKTKEFSGVPAFSIDLGRRTQSPWVLVGHPLWDWGDVPPTEGSILKAAFDAALDDGPAAPHCWDTFNLERRQVMVREEIRQSLRASL